MDASTRAPGYDLYKLIVAIILLVVSLILMWRAAPQSLAQTATSVPNPSATPPPNSGQPLAAAPTIAPASPTSLPLTGTPVPIPSPTGTNTSALTVTPLPSPTATPGIQSTATPIVQIPSAEDVCEAASSRSRLQVGTNATILRRLNFRSSPGIHDNWLLTNISGTEVEIVGGPVCVPHFISAYLWWQIKLPDGRTGWSAEASWRGAFYFMEPAR